MKIPQILTLIQKKSHEFLRKTSLLVVGVDGFEPPTLCL